MIKNFFIYFFFLVLFLVLVTFINYKIDYQDIYHSRYVDKIIRDLNNNKSFPVNKDFNEKKLKSFLKINVHNYKILVCGASRAGPLSTNLLNENVLNLSARLSNSTDFKNYCGENFKNPELYKIIYSIDPYAFAFKNLNDNEYSLKYFEIFHRYKYLLSINYFYENINYLFAQKKINSRSSYLVINKDGSISYIDDPRKNFTEIQKQMLIQSIDPRQNANIRIDIKILDNFFTTVLIPQSKMYQVELLLAPYHPLFFTNSKKKKEIYFDFENNVKAKAQANNIKIIGSYDLDKTICNTNEFIDIQHPYISCYQKLF
jgi:hypothetical protein